jgi:hypothetical protein
MYNDALIVLFFICSYILVSILNALLIPQNDSKDTEFILKSLLWIIYYPGLFVNLTLKKVRIMK